MNTGMLMSEILFRLLATSFNPIDGNPSELIIENVSGFLAIRGFGLPGCGFSSTVPQQYSQILC